MSGEMRTNSLPSRLASMPNEEEPTGGRRRGGTPLPVQCHAPPPAPAPPSQPTFHLLDVDTRYLDSGAGHRLHLNRRPLGDGPLGGDGDEVLHMVGAVQASHLQ